MAWVKDPLGNQVTYDYDTTRGLLKSTTDGLSRPTDYTYDELNRLKTVTKKCSTGTPDDTAEVSYVYENDSLKQISHNGFQYTFNEDGFGNNTEVLAAGKRLVHREYEEKNGNLLSEQ